MSENGGEMAAWAESRWREKSEIPAIDLDGAEFVYDGPPVDAAAEPAIAA